MAEGDLRDDVRANVDWLPSPDGEGWVVRVVLRFAGGVSPRSLALVWGTAVCGNDVVVALPSQDDDMVATGADWPFDWPVEGIDDGGEAVAEPGVGVLGLPRWDVPFTQAFQNGGGSGSGSSSGGSGGSGGGGGGVPPETLPLTTTNAVVVPAPGGWTMLAVAAIALAWARRRRARASQ